jgi:hypothetical protein
VVNHVTRIWHAFVGSPVLACNDMNILQRSPVMTHIVLAEGPPVVFELASVHKYNYDYYLADDIYPRWCTFVKPTVKPKGKKKVDFHNAHAAARKVMERAFEIL